MKILDLCGEWEAKPVARFNGKYGEDGWSKMTVPGHWQQHPDFEYYAGKMVYHTRFESPPRREGMRYFLRFNGVFYWSVVYLNEARVGENEGYFFHRDYEVTDVLEDENDLLVEVDCPDEKTKNRKRLITGVFSHWDCLDPATNPGGIWLPVELIETGDVRIIDPMINASYRTKDYLRVEARLTADSTRKCRINVKITLTPDNFEGKTHVFEHNFLKTPGKNDYLMLMNLDEYELWWTYDHGRPNLYRVKMEIYEERASEPDDTVEFRTGLRTIELRDYSAYLNGRRIFIRGNNYPPSDTRIATVSRRAIEKDFDFIQGAHLNMMRVHAHVDHPLFYEVADERGVLIWQDFPLQWYYDKEVLRPALYQVERMVKTLYNHPSVAFWCCHNEPFKLVDPADIKPLDLLKSAWTILGYNWNREYLDEKLKERILSVDTSRFVQKSSGFQGIGKEPGDEHFYFGWYPPFGSLWNFKHYIKLFKKNIRFPTEFGAQSFPNYKNATKFMDPDIDKVDWEKLEERHHFQPNMMRRFIRHENYNSLEDYIHATQTYQVMVNRFITDRLRRQKYDPTGGVTAFLLLDSNPAVQWSLLDYWREPKESYYDYCVSMNPQYVFAIVDKPWFKVGEAVEIPIYIVNDEYIRWADAKVDVHLGDPDGETVLKKSLPAPLEPDMEAREVGVADFRPKKGGVYRLDLKLQYGDMGGLENFYLILVK